MKKYEPMDKLKEKRTAKGLSRADLAEKAGITYMAVAYYENGERFPRKEVLCNLARSLDCSIADII